MTSAPEYPRVYPIEKSARRYYRGVPLVLVGVAAFGTAGQLMGWIRRSTGPLGMVFWDAVLVAIAASIWVKADRYVTLQPDSISVTDWRGTRTLRREQIRGRQFRKGGRHGVYTFLVMLPVEGAGKELTLPPALRQDGHFHAWMSGIPLV